MDIETKMTNKALKFLKWTPFYKLPKWTFFISFLVKWLCKPLKNFNITMNIDKAVGYNLDLLGQIHFVERLDLNDEDYKTKIKEKIILTHANCTSDDINSAFKIMYKPLQSFITEEYYRTIVLYVNFNNNIPSNFDAIKKILPSQTRLKINYTNRRWIIVKKSVPLRFSVVLGARIGNRVKPIKTHDGLYIAVAKFNTIEVC